MKKSKKTPRKKIKVNPFIDEYNWEGINYPS